LTSSNSPGLELFNSRENKLFGSVGPRATRFVCLKYFDDRGVFIFILTFLYNKSLIRC